MHHDEGQGVLCESMGLSLLQSHGGRNVLAVLVHASDVPGQGVLCHADRFAQGSP